MCVSACVFISLLANYACRKSHIIIPFACQFPDFSSTPPVGHLGPAYTTRTAFNFANLISHYPLQTYPPCGQHKHTCSRMPTINYTYHTFSLSHTLAHSLIGLSQLDANLGVSTDNQTTPPLPPYLPPLLFFLPWVLKACTLGQEYLPGRTVAVQLLCEMNIRHCRTPHPPEQLAVFYLLLQRSLQPSSVSLLLYQQTVELGLCCNGLQWCREKVLQFRMHQCIKCRNLTLSLFVS